MKVKKKKRSVLWASLLPFSTASWLRDYSVLSSTKSYTPSVKLTSNMQPLTLPPFEGVWNPGAKKNPSTGMLLS